MLRTRVSTLEQFRRCVQTEYGSEDELALAIRGQPVAPSWAMNRGTELHRLLASEDHNVVRYGVQRDDQPSQYRFHGHEILQLRQYIGEGLWEVEQRRIFDAGDDLCEVKGTADWLWGNIVQDQKCKTSVPDPRDYEDSLQWRFYLLIHGADVFRYNLFYFDKPDDNHWSRLNDVCSVSFWRYPGLERDCKDWLARFLDWCESNGLLSFLERP